MRGLCRKAPLWDSPALHTLGTYLKACWAHTGEVGQLRDVWEATGFRLEREQSAEETVEQEQRGLAAREAPRWSLPWTPTRTPDEVLNAPDKPRVAILRCAIAFAGTV